MNLTLLKDATAEDEPLQSAEVESYLILDSGTQPDNLARMITAARLEAENENGRELAVKQWRLSLDRFPLGSGTGTGICTYSTPYGERQYLFGFSGSAIELLDPLVSVEKVTFRKADGSTLELAADVDYIVDTDKHPGVIMPAYGKTWPTDAPYPSGAVKIEFTAGMVPEVVPGTIKQGMALLVSQWFEGRIPFEAIRFVAELPFSVSSLFRNGKLWKF